MNNYLNLLSKSVRNTLYPDSSKASVSNVDIDKCKHIVSQLSINHPEVLKENPHLFDPNVFAKMISYTKRARAVHSFVNEAGISNVINCSLDAANNEIPGDFVEVGTLRGGIGIIMAGIIREFNLDKNLHIFDSFEGLSEPNKFDSKFDQYVWHQYRDYFSDHEFDCKCSLAEVKDNFSKYDLNNIPKFYKGWIPDCFFEFKSPICCLRIDVDWHQATFDSLEALYQHVSSGGYVIIDDYNLEGCKTAVDQFISKYSLNIKIEYACKSSGIIYWKKS